MCVHYVDIREHTYKHACLCLHVHVCLCACVCESTYTFRRKTVLDQSINNLNVWYPLSNSPPRRLVQFRPCATTCTVSSSHTPSSSRKYHSWTFFANFQEKKRVSHCYVVCVFRSVLSGGTSFYTFTSRSDFLFIQLLVHILSSASLLRLLSPLWHTENLRYYDFLVIKHVVSLSSPSLLLLPRPYSSFYFL